MHYRPIRNPIRFRSLPAKLSVPHPTYESARSYYPACEETALRAFTRSEACRYANALIRPVRLPQNFSNVIALFADADGVGHAALRAKRFDFMLRLTRSDRFKRGVAARLMRQGKLAVQVAA